MGSSGPASPQRRSRLLRLLPPLIAASAALMLAAPQGASAALAGGRAIASPPGVSVLGSQLLNDGVPWIPRGVQIVGLVAPDRALSGKYIAAHRHFGARELSAARAEGADAVRFQVSQFGLDPGNVLFSAAYVREVARTASRRAKARPEGDRLAPVEPPAGRGDPLPASRRRRRARSGSNSRRCSRMTPA